MTGPQWAPLSLTTNKLLILCWDIHLQNHRGGWFSDHYDDESPDSPYPDYNITSTSQPSPPNTSQEGDISLEGDQAEPRRKYQCKQCPKPVWEQGSDGKMKRLELNKFNRQLYALTFGPQNLSPMAHKMTKKRMRLNYKQYKRILLQNGHMPLQSMAVGDKFLTVDELMASPLDKYITIAVNDCVYVGMSEELIVNYIHPLFFKAKSAFSQQDNPNWREAKT